MSMAIAYNMKKRRMAEGGGVKGVHAPLGENRYARGQSAAGRYTRDKNTDSAKNMHEKTLRDMHSMRDQDRSNLAEGGEVCPTCHGERYAEGGDVVDRIMGKYSEGGRVANDIDEDVDCKEAQFDVLPEEDDLSEHETEANSGDDVEDAQENEDENDMVSRIMRSRSKRDKNPRPA